MAVVIGIVSGFVEELRAAGVPVGIAEHVDAMRAVEVVSLDDRAQVRFALGSTLVKSCAEWATFETVFDAYFSDEGAAGDPRAEERFRRRVHHTVANGDGHGLRAVAREAVRRYAGLGTPPGGLQYHLSRTLRRLDFATLPHHAVELATGGSTTAPRAPTRLEAHLARRTATLRADQLRDEIESEIRRRVAFDALDDPRHDALVAEQLDIRRATTAELEQIRAALRPLARRLAARLARSRRRTRGRLHVRHTIRRSLSYGGVPLDPVIHGRRRALPEIMVLADVSRSVADFSRFTLQLVHALSAQAGRVRSFVFVDAIEEVTEQLRDRANVVDAIRNLGTTVGIARFDGHSDYGQALTEFLQRWGREVTPRTTLIVLGDARNNDRPSQSWALGELRRRARRVFWLNPEPVATWDTSDSLMAEYGALADGTFECRNLEQLERFVERCW